MRSDSTGKNCMMLPICFLRVIPTNPRSSDARDSRFIRARFELWSKIDDALMRVKGSVALFSMAQIHPSIP